MTLPAPSPRLVRWLTNLAQSVYSVPGYFKEPLDTVQFDRHIHAQWLVSPWHIRLSVYLIATLIQWSALLRFARPFSALNSQLQMRWLLMWTHSPLPIFRLSIRLVLTLVKPAYFEQFKVQQNLNYSRPISDRIKTKRPVSKRVEPPHRPKLTKGKRHQVVIIGTGAGGAVLGAELAAAGLDVAFVESGAWYGADDFTQPPLTTLRKTYRDGGLSIAYGRPNIPLPQGETVGGSTTINSGTCFRIPGYVSEKLDRANIGLSLDTLAPHYTAVETRLSVKPVGAHLLGGSTHVIANGAQKLGLNHGPLHRNIDGCKRSAQCAFGCPEEAKQSMHLTYLPDAIKHGAVVYDRTQALRVKFSGQRATGVVVQEHGRSETIEIKADIVVSACGTVRGVPLLRKSGISNPHLGRHLSIHPASKITALMPDAIHGWNDTPQGYGIFDLLDEGILFEGAYVPPEYGVVSLPFVGESLGEVMSNYDRLAIFGLFVADGPNGKVSTLPNGRPLVSYWLSKADAEKFRKGLKLLSQVFFAGGAQSIFLPIANRERHQSIDSALDALSQPLSPWDLELVAFHPLGTARMSSRKAEGVVDPTGAVWGRENLYVADGSVFPTSLGVNPQLTIMATARHIAQHIIAKF